MINTCTILTTDYAILSAGSVNRSNVHFLFQITDTNFFDKLQLSLLHKTHLFDDPTKRFSVCLTASNFKENSQYVLKHREQLLHCIFHPNYLIIFQKPVLFFDSKIKELPEFNLFIDELQDIVIKQGYDGLSVLFFQDEATKTNHETACVFAESGNELYTKYYALLKNHCYSSNYLLLKENLSVNELEARISILEKAEQQFSKDFTSQYMIMKENDQVKKANLELKEKLRLSLLDLENQKTYLEIMKEEDEAIKINDFYYNEYEILPGWYKKAGHLLKVMMGKRTFRSLFDNNVKKYKD